MVELVLGNLERAPFAGEIVVFVAGSDPLEPQAAALLNWLAERNIAYRSIDALRDASLSTLLEAPASRRLLPALCANGRLIGSHTISTLLDNPEPFARWLLEPQRRANPRIWCTRRGLLALRRQVAKAEGGIRLSISAELSHELTLTPPDDQDWVIRFEDVAFALDTLALARSNGVVIDWIEADDVAGFVFDNPNDSLGVRRIGCPQLLTWLEGDTPPILIDVRSEVEFQEARITGARHLDATLLEALTALDRGTPLALYCNNGVKSTSIARRYADLGFIDIVALDGGLEAWKRHFRA